MSDNPIGPGLFDFLDELAQNNNREWFEEHKPRFKAEIQLPMVALIEQVGDWLASEAPAFVADTRLNGGSLFRIYRDTRFGTDKTPYKTNVGCQFRHRAGKDAHAPGFYLHIAPQEVFFGGGIWRPPTPVLNKIRDRIVECPDEWASVLEDKSLRRLAGGVSSDSSLKRPPRGYPADHPHLEDLQRKSLFAMVPGDRATVCAKDFPDQLLAGFGAVLPLMRFIVEGMELGWD